MSSLMLKLILVGVMFFTTLLIGLAPIRKAALAQTSRKQRFVSLFLCLLTCFSGGVFLATCFLHLLPELNEHLLKMKTTHHYHWDCNSKKTYYFLDPVAELLSCIGFFLLFFFEEMVIVFFPSIAHNHSQHSHTHTHIAIPTMGTEPERCETQCDGDKENPPIFIKRRPHAHSHGIRSMGFVLAISFHSVVEGIALGQIWAIFLSLMIHKIIVAFSVGLQLARTHAHALRWVCISIFLFAAMTPIGACAGAFVQNAQLEAVMRDWLILIFQGVAVGTFIYVLIHERDNEHPNLLKLVFMCIGFSIIGLFRLFASHSHSGHDYSGHDHVTTVPIS